MSRLCFGAANVRLVEKLKYFRFVARPVPDVHDLNRVTHDVEIDSVHVRIPPVEQWTHGTGGAY